ncbi:MAG: hypothetical protein SF052_04825 [Bacteroidia bacterium]|nr:hypothetical protein [Bacteroidia bacterium]
METETSSSPEKILQNYRQKLWLMILISSGIDLSIFIFETPLIISFWGASLIVDEIVEYVISSLIAGTRLKLKRGYKIFGVLPLPGLTSLSTQALIELIRSHRKPEKVLEKLQS